jgi:hypothetical protein
VGLDYGIWLEWGLSLPSLWTEKFICWFKSSWTKRMSRMQQNKDKFFHEENPKLETSYRRYDGEGGVNDFTERIWDAIKKLPRVEELLRKQSTREEENERVLRKEEENERRITKLAQLSRTEGWEIIVSLLKNWENFCYMNLRFPETRKDKVSFDYFIGFQNGALWVIEGLRKEVYGAVISLKKQNAIRNKESRE